MRHSKRKLKGILIYPPFQLRLIALNLVILLITVGAIGFQIERMFSEMRKFGADANLPEGHVYYKFIDYEVGQISWGVGLAFLVAGVISLLLTAYYSHKLVGPIVRIRQFFVGLSEGETIRALEFRKGDYFSELPSIINAGVGKIEGSARRRS